MDCGLWPACDRDTRSRAQLGTSRYQPFYIATSAWRISDRFSRYYNLLARIFIFLLVGQVCLNNWNRRRPHFGIVVRVQHSLSGFLVRWESGIGARISQGCSILRDRTERNEAVHDRSLRSLRKKNVFGFWVHAEYWSSPATSVYTNGVPPEIRITAGKACSYANYGKMRKKACLRVITAKEGGV